MVVSTSETVSGLGGSTNVILTNGATLSGPGTLDNVFIEDGTLSGVTTNDLEVAAGGTASVTSVTIGGNLLVAGTLTVSGALTANTVIVNGVAILEGIVVGRRQLFPAADFCRSATVQLPRTSREISPITGFLALYGDADMSFATNLSGRLCH